MLVRELESAWRKTAASLPHTLPEYVAIMCKNALGAYPEWCNMLRSKLFEENKMQRFMAVSNRLRYRPFLWPAAIGLAIMLQALALHGFPMILLHRAEAQTPQPSVSAPGFSPAKPFRFRNKYPPYPRDAVRLGEEGTVRVKVTISETGKVVNAQVIRSSGSAMLDDAATGWIKYKWRYYPAILRGRPVSSNLTYNIKFMLKG